MRYLAVVDSCFLDSPGGGAKVAWDIACLARDAGCEVTLLCNSTASDAAAAGELSAGIRLVRYGLPGAGGLRQIDEAARVVRTMLRHESWDVVHLHSFLGGLGAARALGGADYLYTAHTPAVDEALLNWTFPGRRQPLKALLGAPLIKRLERRLLDNARRVHILSTFTEERLRETHGLKRELDIVPHWVPQHYRRTMTRQRARQKLGWPRGLPLLFTARGMKPRTGVDVAIDAIAPLAASGKCRFAIAGDGALRDTFQQRAAQAGVDRSQLWFTGRLSDDDLLLAFQAADLFVLPTVALECFGLVILEALAMGCPVLGTDGGAIPLLLAPITPELIVPAGDARRLRHTAQAFLAGDLTMPAEQEMVDYINGRFGLQVVAPQMLQWLGVDVAARRVGRLEIPGTGADS